MYINICSFVFKLFGSRFDVSGNLSIFTALFASRHKAVCCQSSMHHPVQSYFYRNRYKTLDCKKYFVYRHITHDKHLNGSHTVIVIRISVDKNANVLEIIRRYGSLTKTFATHFPFFIKAYINLNGCENQ